MISDWVALLKSHLLYDDGTASKHRRAWNWIDTLITDDTATEKLNFSMDLEALLGNTSTDPVQVESSAGDFEGELGTWARGDHVHRLGDDADDGVPSINFNYSASGAPGEAVGWKINELIPGSGGNSVLLQLQKDDTDHYRFVASGSGGTIWTADDQLIVAADSHTFDLTPETTSASESLTSVHKYIAFRNNAIPAAGVFFNDYTIPDDTIAQMVFHVCLADDPPTEFAYNRSYATVQNVAGTHTLVGDSQPISHGTNPDSPNVFISGTNKIRYVQTNVGSTIRNADIILEYWYVTP